MNTLKEETSTDSLTKLLNRHALEKKIKVLTEQQKNYTLVMLDVDWFKSINDTYGHIAGDEVLQILASKLKESLQEDDLACRYGEKNLFLSLQKLRLKMLTSGLNRFGQMFGK